MTILSNVKASFKANQEKRKAEDKQTAKMVKDMWHGKKNAATATYVAAATIGHGGDYALAKLAGRFISKTAGNVVMGLGVASLAYNTPRHCRVINNIYKDEA